ASIRDSLLDEEIKVWKGLVRDLLLSDATDAILRLREAIQDRVNAHADAGIDTQFTTEVWEDARQFWEEMIQLLETVEFGSSLTTLRENLALATRMAQG